MSLPHPGTCSLDLIDAIVAERQNGKNARFFANIGREWRAKVEHYINHCGSPEYVRPWPEIAHKEKSFLSLYNSPTVGSAQGNMLKVLRDHDLNLCPACGELGSPNTLDHYLPKRRYPHFAVTPLNLFPMCDACQGAKGEKTGDLASPRYFIHPYFDTFSIPQIVVLTISPPFDAPSFVIAPHPDLTPDETTLVTVHLRELEISERYVRYFRGQHRRLLKLVKHMRDNGQDVVQMLELFKFNAASSTQNSWDHVFYVGVLSNPDLVQFLVNEELPQFL